MLLWRDRCACQTRCGPGSNFSISLPPKPMPEAAKEYEIASKLATPKADLLVDWAALDCTGRPRPLAPRERWPASVLQLPGATWDGVRAKVFDSPAFAERSHPIEGNQASLGAIAVTSTRKRETDEADANYRRALELPGRPRATRGLDHVGSSDVQALAITWVCVVGVNALYLIPGVGVPRFICVVAGRAGGRHGQPVRYLFESRDGDDLAWRANSPACARYESAGCVFCTSKARAACAAMDRRCWNPVCRRLSFGRARR